MSLFSKNLRNSTDTFVEKNIRYPACKSDFHLFLNIFACANLKKNAVQSRFMPDKNKFHVHLCRDFLKKSNFQTKFGPNAGMENWSLNILVSNNQKRIS